MNDIGEGIASKHVAHVFDRFYRADSSRACAGQYGPGFSHLQSVVEAMGGTIGVESVMGQGSRFRFTLPLVGEAELKRSSSAR